MRTSHEYLKLFSKLESILFTIILNAIFYFNVALTEQYCISLDVLLCLFVSIYGRMMKGKSFVFITESRNIEYVRARMAAREGKIDTQIQVCVELRRHGYRCIIDAFT